MTGFAVCSSKRSIGSGRVGGRRSKDDDDDGVVAVDGDCRGRVGAAVDVEVAIVGRRRRRRSRRWCCEENEEFASEIDFLVVGCEVGGVVVVVVVVVDDVARYRRTHKVRVCVCGKVCNLKERKRNKKEREKRNKN